MPSGQHIAQLNIGLLRYPAEDARSSGFVDNTARVNAIAERSKGFVWRCQDEEAGLKADGVVLFGGDPRAVCTMSVWETAADLEAFVHRTVHGAFLKRRSEWFVPAKQRTYVIWPVTAGHIPDFREGMDRMAALQADGPSENAYDFKYLAMDQRHEG